MMHNDRPAIPLLLPACFSALLVLSGGCKDEEPTGTCESDPVTLPAELGIVDDDAKWLCDNLPEPAVEDPNFGQKIAGATSCVGGERGAVSGSNIYVATDGSDSASGATAGEALATVQEALCRVAPGQTIHIAPGTYPGAAAVAALGDAQSDEIVIRGEGSTPDEVILDGEYWRSAALSLGESHNIRIENLTVQHYIDAGIQTLNGSKITIRNIVSRSNGRCSVNEDSAGEGFGINLVGTEDILVEQSTFEDNGPLLSKVRCGIVLGTGINTFAITGRIRENTIRHTRGGAMLIEDGGPAIVENNVGEQNFLLALNNYWDAGLWVDGSVDVEVRGNTFRESWGGVGIMITDEEKAYPQTSKGTLIQGNTVDGHLAGVLVWGYGACPPPSDVITNYESLESDNTLTNNTYQGEGHPVWCVPEFIGGQVP